LENVLESFDKLRTSGSVGKILLYYKYIEIEDPHAVMRWQKKLCTDLGLKGRVLIATEGINGTVGGTAAATQAYIEAMQAHELFHDVVFKSSAGSADDFPKLRIVVRDEIVSLSTPKKLHVSQTGTHLTPAQAHQLMQDKPANLVILDARNNYESAIGTFKDAITPDIENFRDLPGYIDQNLEQFKDKQVLMFCTGGVRCELATAYLKEKNIAQDVLQIEGGIHCYAEQFPDGFFRGKNYVFDGRIAMKVNDDILSSCYHCKQPCNDYTNCLNAECNLQYISCAPCVTAHESACSAACQQLINTASVIVRTIPKQTELRKAAHNNRAE
jgi:predicted sulfurtransferase